MENFIEAVKSLWFLWVPVLAAGVYTFYAARIKGWVGEKFVAIRLGRLPKEEYTVLHDILLPAENGTTQIDHVVVSLYGVFVIETKNYNGWIFGSEYSKQWTQSIYRHKERFMNPIHQNYGHVQALKGILAGYEEVLYVPIVAFSPKCTLKVKAESHVVYYGQMNKVIRRYKDKVILPEQVAEIAAILLAQNKTGAAARAEHIAGIQEKKINRAATAEVQSCPLCGAYLQKKKGRYGMFWGCRNYPVCRFTKKLS